MNKMTNTPFTSTFIDAILRNRISRAGDEKRCFEE